VACGQFKFKPGLMKRVTNHALHIRRGFVGRGWRIHDPSVAMALRRRIGHGNADVVRIEPEEPNPKLPVHLNISPQI
jgi:hypothetical protein